MPTLHFLVFILRRTEHVFLPLRFGNKFGKQVALSRITSEDNVVA